MRVIINFGPLSTLLLLESWPLTITMGFWLLRMRACALWWYTRSYINSAQHQYQQQMLMHDITWPKVSRRKCTVPYNLFPLCLSCSRTQIYDTFGCFGGCQIWFFFLNQTPEERHSWKSFFLSFPLFSLSHFYPQWLLLIMHRKRINCLKIYTAFAWSFFFYLFTLHSEQRNQW